MHAPASRVTITTALRRVVVGYRVVGAMWLCLLGAVAVSQGASPAPVFVTMGLALGWTALTVTVARRPQVLRSWAFVAADLVVSAGTILVPSVGATSMTAFFGGYPFSTVALAAAVRGMSGALVSAAALATATVARIALQPGPPRPQEVVESVVFYVVGAAILAWANGVLVRNEEQRLAAEAALAEERTQRVRSQERAETAAHLHDSVLQTLALIQRRSGDPGEVNALARRQERELREWLAGPPTAGGAAADGLTDALAAVGEEVEARHRVTVDLVTVGEAPVDDDVAALVAATREAVTNAATHAGVGSVSVFAEATAGGIAVFVRDRGAGFDPGQVPADRRGISESIVGRMARHGGSARISAAPGMGTEVELLLPRPAPTVPSSGP
ncbi:MAG: histidine kinase [Euzebyales bacterium]|nr:histidine kinase [Euzebyales bacterium]